MATTFIDYTGDGNATKSFSFPSIQESDVKVEVDGVIKSSGTHYNITSYTTTGGGNVVFTSGNIPSSPAAIRIFRDTDVDTAKATYTAGSSVKAADLNNNHEQLLFAAQEEQNQTVTTSRIKDAAVTTAKIAADAVTGAKIGDDQINSEHYVDGSIDTAHIADGQITSAKIADGTIATVDLANNAVTESKILANSVTTGKIADDAVTTNKILNSNVSTDKLANLAVTNGKMAANAVSESKIVDLNVTTAKIAQNAVTTAKILDDNVTTDKIANNAVTSSKIADNAVSVAKIADSELSTLAGMQAGTASKLADSTALTADIADLNQIDGMAKQTTITDDDTKFPTSGAVVDYVAAQLEPFGGFEAIANEVSFPNTQPPAGVAISIADAAGIVVNGSGTSTTGRTVGGTTVTINNINSQYNSSTVASGIRFIVTSTGSGQVYNYHKSTLPESDLVNLSGDINDFNERYRVGGSNPTSSLDSGDLFFNTSTGKLLVYNGTNSAWEEAQSVGNFFISTLSPAFNGSLQNFTITNAPTNAEQILLVINGVVQKPNAGTSTPSEGFALDGSTVKLGAAPATGSTYHAVVIGSTVNIGTPSNNTVSSAILQNGSVIEAKLGTGAVVAAKIGSGAVTQAKIGGEAIDEARLQVSNSPVNGYFLSAQSGNTGGLTWAQVDLTALSASNLTSGTVPDARFPSTLPAVSGANLTNLPAANLTGALPAISGANLTGLNTDVVSDTTPQLGSNLDTNSFEISFDDNHSAIFGDGSDLKILHTGSESRIDFSNTSHDLKLMGSGGSSAIELNPRHDHNSVKAIANGAVELYHDNSKKFETISTGFDAGDLKFRDTSNTDKMLTVGNTDTTTPRWSTTRQGIKIAGSNPVIYGHTTTDSKGSYLGLSNGQVYLGSSESGQILFQTSGSGTSGTNRWYITADGHFRPASNDTYDIGTTSDRVRNIYTNDLHLSNEGGSNDVDGTWGNWTIQEGESDLFLKNNRSGKKYKFNLTEVS